jgi:hypothetical protein
MADSFVFYRSFIDALRDVSPEEFKATVVALAGYALDGEDSADLSGTVRMAMAFMKPLMDSNRRKREAGRRGGIKSGEARGSKPKHDEAPGSKTEKPRTNEDVDVDEDVDEDVNLSKPRETNQDFPDSPSFPTAAAVDPGEVTTALVPAPQGPPPLPKKSRKLELTAEQLQLFYTAKTCFEASEKAKALLYQDESTTAMEMRNLKILVIRCLNMAPGITADFMRNILEHFRMMTNGRLKGKAAFTPRSLITPWIWELVIDSLPENDVTPELREDIRGLFK